MSGECDDCQEHCLECKWSKIPELDYETTRGMIFERMVNLIDKRNEIQGEIAMLQSVMKIFNKHGNPEKDS